MQQNKTTYPQQLLNGTYIEIENDSNDTIAFTNYICHITVILMLLGIVGNILSVYVFLQRKRRHFYLLLLASFELVFCVIIFIDYFFRMIYNKSMFLHDLNIFINIIIDFLIHTIDSFTVIITLLLSIDRLYAIQHPIKINYFITKLHPIFLAVSSLLIMVVLRIPSVLLCYENRTSDVNAIYCTLISPLIFNIIPTILILILNIILIVEIARIYHKRFRK